MSTDEAIPDYDLEDVRVITTPQEAKAAFHPLRGDLLDLLHERAASVQELASSVGRPKSSVAYHVGLLLAADLIKVVRTRKIRGVQERFYGRTARIFYLGPLPEGIKIPPGPFEEAAAESASAQQADDLRAIKRYAWIPEAEAEKFWRRVFALVNEYAQLPRDDEGEAYAFLAALYPTEHPRLPRAATET